MLYAAAQTLARGRRAGFMAAIGLHLGCYVHVVAAALGLSVLFTSVPVLYLIFKIMGAGYLIWLGAQVLFSRESSSVTSIEERWSGQPMRTFRDSIVIEILNPKTAIFYIAFLPLFSDPSATLPLWAQLLILGTLVNIAFSSADIVCILLASAIMEFTDKSAGANRLLHCIGGIILIGLGINLILGSR